METDDVVVMHLVSMDGSPLPQFTAGAHIDVAILPEVTRQYSLCNNPSDRTHYEIAVLRERNSRGGSAALHDRFDKGDTLRISLPRNHFPLESRIGKVLLIAGGIGVTPLLSMAQHLNERGADFELHYCTRTRERTAFHRRLAECAFRDRVFHHFDESEPASALDPQRLLFGLGSLAPVYVCGPAGFIDWICNAAKAEGLPEASLHKEYFASETAAADKSGDTPFCLQLARSGKTIEVGAEETAADALARHGIQLPISCQQGICGTCVTRVLDGVPEHRDMLMIDGDNDFTPCCSRSKTPLLVIDL